MNSIASFAEIDLSQRITLIAQACCIASRYPGLAISQSKTSPWVYDLHSLYPEFDRVGVPLEQLISNVENVVMILMARHPEVMQQFTQGDAGQSDDGKKEG